MQRYERRARYDDAIAAGVDYTNQHPNDGRNNEVFTAVAVIFLEKAKRDGQRVDDYVSQALYYRDKALPVASDANLGWYSMNTLGDVALISESAGDLSEKQRCLQYRNAAHGLQVLLDRLDEKQTEISRRIPNTEDRFGVSRDRVAEYAEQTHEMLARVKGKQQKAACE